MEAGRKDGFMMEETGTTYTVMVKWQQLLLI